MTLKSPFSISPMNQLVDRLRKRLLETQEIDDYLIHSLLCSDSLNHSLLEIMKYFQEHIPFQHIEVWKQDINSSFYHQFVLLHHHPDTIESRKNGRLLDFSMLDNMTSVPQTDPLFSSLHHPFQSSQNIILVKSDSLINSSYATIFYFENNQSTISPLLHTVAFLITCFIDIASLAIPNGFFYDEIRSVPIYLHPLLALEQFRDFTLRKHSYSVMHLAETLASELGLSTIETNQLRIAAFLHDIGKLLLPEELLRKQETFSEEEYLEVQQHVVYGTDLAILFGLDSHVQQIIYEHHERFDGSGYPEGKKGKKLLLASSILGVADVYTALQEHRPYQDKQESHVALHELIQNPHKKYDPLVIQALIKVLS